MEIIAQILSIIGMIGTVLAFQIKKTSHFCFATMCTCTLFAASYILLGSYTAAGINLICAVRGALAANPKTHTKLWLIIICAAQIIATAFTFGGILSIAVCAAELLNTYAMWLTSELTIRRVRYAITSPIWLINNICVGVIGGIICEIFTIVSAIIFCIRMRKKA